MADRECQGKTKKGQPCKAAPLRDSSFCLAHANEETRESAGFGGSQPNAGRPRVPRVTEVMRDWVEEHAHEILAPYRDAIRGAMILVTYEGVATVSEIPDLGARIAAAEKLQDRVLGKPRQALEHTGAEGGPIAHTLDLTKLTDEQLAVLEAIQPDAGSANPS